MVLRSRCTCTNMVRPLDYGRCEHRNSVLVRNKSFLSFPIQWVFLKYFQVLFFHISIVQWLDLQGWANAGLNLLMATTVAGKPVPLDRPSIPSSGTQLDVYIYTPNYSQIPQCKDRYLYRQFGTQGKGRAENILSLVIVIQWTWLNYF